MKRLQDIGHAVLEVIFLKAVRVKGGHIGDQGDDCFPDDDLFRVSIFQSHIADRLEEVAHCLNISRRLRLRTSHAPDVYSEAWRRRPTLIPESHR
jgi:hypothetical protein